MTDAGKNFLNEVITGDEAWCFAYDPETRRQVFEWVGEKFPLPIKRKFQFFFDSECVVHKEFVPEGKQ
jgi:hypothetical protein